MWLLYLAINPLLLITARCEGGGISESQTCEQKRNPVAFTDVAEDTIQQGKIKLPACPKFPNSGFAADCSEVLLLGNAKNGVAKIWPRSRAVEDAPFNVYCDMETDGGGWTVIQRRGNFSRPKDYFYKNWKDYKKGFGNNELDFWLGNDKIFALTNQNLYSVRFDLEDIEGEKRYAVYDKFWIDGEDNGYMLHVKDYSGDAGDSLAVSHDGQKFSTKDKDNDNSSETDCATTSKGAWWYNECFDSSLNGVYIEGKHELNGEGLVWKTWKGNYESLAMTEIKIRPRTFVKSALTKSRRLCIVAKVLDSSA